jgi:hypothetical protein
MGIGLTGMVAGVYNLHHSTVNAGVLPEAVAQLAARLDGIRRSGPGIPRPPFLSDCCATRVGRCSILPIPSVRYRTPQEDGHENAIAVLVAMLFVALIAAVLAIPPAAQSDSGEAPLTLRLNETRGPIRTADASAPREAVSETSAAPPAARKRVPDLYEDAGRRARTGTVASSRPLPACSPAR